jgi:WD40 repeat protein
MGGLFSRSTVLDTSTPALTTSIIPSTRPLRVLEGGTTTVAVFPDKRRIVTASHDKTLRLWDLKTGMVLKVMEGHRNKVEVLVVSRDGQIIASGDENGEIIAWHGETGEPLTQPIKAHSDRITSLDFSPDGMVLATGSWDTTTKFWCTETWQTQGNPIQCHATIHCVRYSPQATSNFRRGQPQETPQVQLEVAIATSAHIEIYDSYTRQRVAYFEAHSSSLAWVSDKRLLSGGDHVIAIHPTGTLVASVSDNNHVRLWRLEDRQIIAIFQHASIPTCVTFSVDGKHILCGGQDKISEWAVPNCIHPKVSFYS